MFRFLDRIWLFGLAGLLPVAGLLWWAAKRRARALSALGDAELVRRLTASVSVVGRRWKAVLQLAALALLVVALARPQFGTRVETVRSRGQDIVVALDVSRSMLAEDVSPNRLERARLSILRLIDDLSGDRIALVAFAGDAFVQSPLTADYAAARMFLRAMNPDMMPVQGTDLGAALGVSLDALEHGARDARVVVIVTDGEDHEADFELALQRAVEDGVRVHVVGVGSVEGVPIPLYGPSGSFTGFLRDEEGSVVTTRLGDETLRTVAERTGARYVRAGVGGAAFDDLVHEITRVDGEELEERRVTIFEEQFQLFAALAFVLLLVEWLVPDRRRAAAVVAALFLALPGAAAAQAGRTQVQEGNRLYEEGRFGEAHQRYLEGLAEAPESGVIVFNDGNALYRTEEYERAVDAYRRAVESGDPELASAAWYNLGNALYRQQQLETSLEAYKQALRLDPSDVDAKHNLERVLQELQQQEQQQNQDQSQDEQDQQGQDQDQQGRGDQSQDQQGQDDESQGDQPQDPSGGDSSQDEDESQQDEREGRGQAQPEPGQMTQEEAERLLEAVQEDPDGVERPVAPATGRVPRRPW